MAKPLGYLSFDIEHDESSRGLFIEQAAQGPTPFAIEHWSLKLQKPQDDWQKLVQGHVGRADFMVVLVGAETSTCAEVVMQIQMAKRTNVPFFGVRVAGTDKSTALPDGLPANRTIPWDWALIAAAVQQLSSEGKHHVFA